MTRVLLTGGAGYIGSHTLTLLNDGPYEPVILDDFSNCSPRVLDRLETICGRRPEVFEGDMRDENCLERIFGTGIHVVIHFAGLKAVGESVEQPLRYHCTNVGGTLALLDVMQRHGCKRMVFSSSAAVYAPSETLLREDAPLAPTSPYGNTKRIIEDILRDCCAADPDWHMMILRYFNPVGAHASGLIGERPNTLPNNLVPYIAQVAAGILPELTVFGTDYPTPDGTGIRDYIHVMDLARGHVAALETLKPGCMTCNLGTGHGHSVMKMIESFGRASGKAIPFRTVDRRPGDLARCCADPSFSAKALNWQAQLDLDTMLADHWRWQKKNPNGYDP